MNDFEQLKIDLLSCISEIEIDQSPELSENPAQQRRLIIHLPAKSQTKSTEAYTVISSTVFSPLKSILFIQNVTYCKRSEFDISVFMKPILGQNLTHTQKTRQMTQPKSFRP